MTEHKKRAEEREKQKPPKNYVCGHCRRVNPYDKEKPYECPHCNYCKPKEIIPAEEPAAEE